MILGGGGEDPKVKGEHDAVSRVLRSKFKNEKQPIISAIRNAAKDVGVSPEMLGASAIQEGMGLAYINQPDKYSSGYNIARKANQIPEDYVVDGFRSFGLNTFSDRYKDIRPYLKKDIEFVPFEAIDEKGNKVNSAAFKSTEDALKAKGAFLRSIQDQVVNKAKDMKLSLDKQTVDYLTMAAYNGGMGNAKIMMDELASGKYNQNDFVVKGLTSRQGVHKNIAPRIQKMKWLADEFNKPSGLLGVLMR